MEKQSDLSQELDSLSILTPMETPHLQANHLLELRSLPDRYFPTPQTGPSLLSSSVETC